MTSSKSNQFLNDNELDQLQRMIERFEDLKKQKELCLMSFAEFEALVDKNEAKIIEKVKTVNPSDYGFKAPYLGIEDVPDDLVKITGQKYLKEGELEQIPSQFLPKPAFLAYQKLNQALKKELDKELVIYGYRSPAYQLYLFLWYLDFYQGDIEKTAQRVAMPGYSEHGSSTSPAVDFMTLEGQPSDENPYDFLETQEWRWLTKNAEEFNFYETFPKDNPHGVIYEPWHYRYIPNA